VNWTETLLTNCFASAFADGDLEPLQAMAKNERWNDPTFLAAPGFVQALELSTASGMTP
jgi:hypothetical protein